MTSKSNQKIVLKLKFQKKPVGVKTTMKTNTEFWTLLEIYTICLEYNFLVLLSI